MKGVVGGWGEIGGEEWAKRLLGGDEPYAGAHEGDHTAVAEGYEGVGDGAQSKGEVVGEAVRGGSP